MGKTERLYYMDSFLRDFEATIVDTSPDDRGVRVYLDRTAFYPESGGQPTDRGLLGGARVLGVIDEGDRIAHVVENGLKGEAVTGTIDWPRRFDHMQQHTGQHVLSAAFERTGGYKTVSFHLGTEVSSIDLDSERPGPRQIEAAESLANEVIFDDRPVKILFRDATEASNMGLRKATEREGEVRLIQVADFDLSACGGTHVRSTGQIGLIAIRRLERIKGHLRVEFICGGRALAASRRDFRTLEEMARLFSAPFLNLPALAARQAEELRNALRTNEKLAQRLAEIEAEEWWAQAELKSGKKVLQEVFEATDSAKAKALAHAVAQLESAVALIGVKGKPAALIFSQSADGRADLGALMRRTLAPYGGKGGGPRNFAQGGGIDESRVAEALALAHSLLLESLDR